MRSVLRLELAEQVPDVRFNRFLGEEEVDTDLLVRVAFGDECEDFDLARARRRCLGGVGLGDEL